jgi:hypothetical protein
MCCHSLRRHSHTPILLRYDGAKIDQHIEIIEIVGVGLPLVAEKHLDIVGA